MGNYQQDLRKAAHRHFEAGEILFGGQRSDVAGYLFGLAAECAIKYLMTSSGMRPLPQNQKHDDPYYAHFELLKTLLRNTVSGRRAGELRKYAETSSFMQHWDISMRYSHGRDIQSVWVDRWRANAKDVISAMEL